MQWDDVLPNQAISYNTLLAATEGRVFLQVGNIPASGEPGTRCITAGMIRSRVEIENEPLVGIPDNRLVLKSQVVPVTRTYYKLIPCGAGGITWTRIPPTFGSSPTLIDRQRYVLYGGTTLFWKWEGESVGPQTTIPTDYNGSIQKVVGNTQPVTGCP
jgi:hypothetical protein